MYRDVTQPHQFLAWTADDTGYLVTWTPGADIGQMSFITADSDFKTWCDERETFPFRSAVVAEVGLEKWAEMQIGFRHDAHLVERRYALAASA